MRRLFWFFRRLIFRNHYESELRQELEAAHELLASEYQSSGMSEANARLAARKALGSADTLREEVHDAWAGALLERFGRDVRYAFRGLRRQPGFALACVLTFGVAIGGTTAIATLVNSLLLKPLPFEDSERLLMVMQRSNGSAGAGHVASQPNIDDWARRNRVFEQLAYYEYLGFNIAPPNSAPEQVGGLRASHELFDVLRAKPLLGRTFLASDENNGNGDIAILSYSLWHDRFAADSAIVGKAVHINKRAFIVIGVMRPDLKFPSARQQLWIPMTLSNDDRSRQSQSFFAVARMKPDASLATVTNDLRRVGIELAREYPDANADQSINAFPLSELWMQDIARILRLLTAAVLLVALMAVVNVSGLLLARGGARRHELGARLALGGSRARLVSQLVTESVVVSVLGGLLGIAVAYIALPVFVSLPGLGLNNLPFRDASDVVINLRILASAVAIAVAAGVVAGAIPALSVIPRSPAALLKRGDERGATARARHGIRGALLAVETGLAVVVLVGAGLLIDSVRRAVAIEPGVNAVNVSLMGLALPQKDFYGIPERLLFCSELQRQTKAIAGVQGVSAVSHVPFSGQNAGRTFFIDGRPAPAPNDEPYAHYGVICPDYFRTMGIPVKSGHDFTDRDVVAAPQVAIVNEAFQKKYFPGTTAVGKRFRMDRTNPNAPWITIVAVVGDVRHTGLVSEMHPYLYRPYSQTVWPNMTVAVKTANQSRAVLGEVQESLRRLIPDEPVGEPFAMQGVVDGSLGYMRFPLFVMLAFAGIAALLTIVGVFGVASQVVVQRTRELGIRRALGATRASLYGVVVTETLIPAAVGLSGGLLVARLSGQVLDGLLYGVKATDASTFALVSVVLVLLTVTACVGPARRAAGVDPARTLRND